MHKRLAILVVLVVVAGLAGMASRTHTPPAQAAPWAVYVDDIPDVGNTNAVGFTKLGPSTYCSSPGSNTKSWQWCWQNGGWGGHYWYTWNCGPGTSSCAPGCGGSGDCNAGVWRPSIPYTKTYRVCAYIPEDHAYTTQARYKVYHAGGMTQVNVPQSQITGWTSLGVFTFNQGTSGYIWLGDYTGETYATKQIGFDVIQWVPDGDSCGGWPGWSGCPAAGAGSSRQALFQQAYDRKGGLGCALGNAYWWNGIVRQDFQNGGSYSAIMHDEGQDSPIYSVPAWVVWGGIRDCYLASYSSLGPPMSDELSQYGHPWVNFRYGYIWWDGSCHAGLWWDGPNGWAILKPGQDTNAKLLIESPPPGSPGIGLPIVGAKLVLDNNGGTGSWVEPPWIYKDIADLNATPNTTLTWTQYDLDRSLVVSFSAIGADGVDRWLNYAANASDQWPQAGWVDMSNNPSGYNTWLTLTRNVYNDYVAEYGVAPKTIRYVHIAHLNQAGWSGDHGGTVGGLEFNGATVVPPAAPANVRGGPAANPNVPHSYEPVNLATGEYTLQATDVAIAGKGEPLAFTRAYSSGDATAGRIGYGWQDNLRARLQFDDPNPAIANVAVVQEEGRQDNYERLADASYLEPIGIFDQLTRNPIDGTFTLSRKDRSKLHFNAAGGLQSMEDRNGNLTTLTYGGGGLLTTVTDPSGRALTLAYDGSNRITSVTDPIGRVTTYAYNGAGDLASVTDPAGHATSYTYDASHRMLTITDPRGNVIMTNVFDGSGHVTSQTNALGQTWNFTYGIGQTTEIDPRTCAITHQYDVRFRETQTTDCLGGVTSYTYDADGNRDSMTDALGHTTSVSYDARGNPLSTTDALGNVTTHTYSVQDDHLSQTDPLGRTTTYTYSTSGNLLTVSDPLGGVASFTYDGGGQLLTSTDPLARTSTFGYNANGYKTSSTDPLGNVTTFAYDNAGRMLSVTDPAGHITSNTYDPLDRVLTTTDALGHVTSNTYDADGNKTTATDANGRVTSVTYDALSHVTSVADPVGGVTAYAYDSVGNRMSVTDANLHTTTYGYDLLNRLTSQTDPLGNTSSTTYDAVGKLTSSADASGSTTTYVYDALNRPTSTTDALGGVSSQTYDAAGQVLTSTDPRGGVSSFTYNANGDRTAATDPLGSTSTFVYDLANRLLSETDPLGHITSYTYDAFDRLLTITDPMGHVAANSYDADGNKSTSTDANGKVTSYAYDALHRLISETDAAGGVTSSSYDAVGNRTAATDANSHANTYAYDQLNRLISTTDPLGHVVTTAYDPVGNATSRTDANGAVTVYSYDAANRLLMKDYPDQPPVSFTYDATGHRLSMADLTGATAYAYDALQRLTSVTNPGGAVVSYAYDSAGNRTAMTYPDGKTVAYTHDAGQRLTGVADWASRTTSYSYDAASRPTTTTIPNGTTTTRAYDTADRLLSVAHKKGASDLLTVGYTLDNEGNRLTRTETTTGSLTDTYGYDNLYRLTSVDYGNPSSPDQTYAYDPAGNRTQLVAGSTTNYAYDAADSLLTVGSTSFSFDNNGNQTRQGNRTFSYDRENRLLQVADWTSAPNGVCADTNWDGTTDSGDLLAIANNFGTRAGTDAYQPVLDPRQDGAVNSGDLLLTSGKFGEQCHVVTASAYNGDGLRIYRSENNATERYTWDIGAGLPVIIQDSTGKGYLYGQDLILEESAGVPTYYYQDGLGSTILTADPAGTILGSYAYDAFGSPRSLAPTFSYTGQQGDASGLLYLRARSYDSTTGRFLARDPVFTTASLYAYASNNPALLADPTGMKGCEWWNLVCRGSKKVDQGKQWVSKKIDQGKQWVNKNVIKPVAAAITAGATWVNNNVVKPVVATAVQVYQTARVVVVQTAKAVVHTVQAIMPVATTLALHVSVLVTTPLAFAMDGPKGAPGAGKCGAAGLDLAILDRTLYYNFGDACSQHDACAGTPVPLGDPQRHRETCDAQFRAIMYSACAAQNPPGSPALLLCNNAAATYSGAVDACSAAYRNWGQCVATPVDLTPEEFVAPGVYPGPPSSAVYGNVTGVANVDPRNGGGK